MLSHPSTNSECRMYLPSMPLVGNHKDMQFLQATRNRRRLQAHAPQRVKNGHGTVQCNFPNGLASVAKHWWESEKIQQKQKNTISCCQGSWRTKNDLSGIRNDVEIQTPSALLQPFSLATFITSISFVSQVSAQLQQSIN